MNPFTPIIPKTFDIIFHVKYKQDDDGFDIIQNLFEIPPTELLKQLKKNKWPWLSAGFLIRFDSSYWNAINTSKDKSKIQSILVDYPSLSLEWYEALINACSNNNKWYSAYYVDKANAWLKQSDFKTISIVDKGDTYTNSTFPRLPFLQLPFEAFTLKLIALGEEFLKFATELIRLAELPEMKLSKNFIKELKQTIKLEKWESSLKLFNEQQANIHNKPVIKTVEVKYKQTESTKIVVGIGYMVEIDGEQISIEPQYFHHYSVTQQLAHQLKRLNPEKEDDQSWQYEIMFATDYDEQYIKQVSWNVMSVRRQFHDGSDVEEKLCDAQTFYKELIKINDWVIENVSAGADLQYIFPKNYQYTLQGLKDSLQTIKDWYHKYYESN